MNSKILGISLIILFSILIIRGNFEASNPGKLLSVGFQNIYELPNNNLIFKNNSYIYLGKGDKLHLTFSLEGANYEVKILIIKVATKEKWEYKEIYYSKEAKSVVFIAPSRGLYYFAINVTVLEVISFPLTFTHNFGFFMNYRNDLNIVYFFFIPIGLFLVSLSFYKRGIKRINSLYWEIKSYYKYYIIFVMVFFFSFFLNNFETVGADKENTLIMAISFDYVNALRILIIFSAIIFSLMFSYEISENSIRDLLITGQNRSKIFFSKLFAGILILYFPIIFVNLIFYFLTDPLLLFADIMLISNNISFILLKDLYLILVSLIYVLIPSVFMTRTILAFTIPILITYLSTIPILQDFMLLPLFYEFISIPVLIFSILICWLYMVKKDLS